MYDIIELNNKLVGELREIAKELEIPKVEKLLKQDLIYKILDQQALTPQKIEKEKPVAKEKQQDDKPEAKKTKSRKLSFYTFRISYYIFSFSLYKLKN